MSLFRDDGIVLRTQKLGEADRIMLQSRGGHGVRLRLRRGPHPQQSHGGAR
ncbi:recombination protein O N-terminal domain-containing protein [Streptomyces sp. NBC_01275]|uniref:recombination protein O N-terminal domain-containing protein n=1 Tax=Streptomyces sp. NBC_01275 TaxID=2903807 RepID=UPI002253243E|nr:recombination protein O N-terminal domain-containing protein [Streptomyces sp. NBC_01275]MCX4762030.1 recombination protein O N-terminal domain-containing protein [Streptomyces sp. NBC_01275]